VVAKDHQVPGAEVGDQPGLLVRVDGDALELVVGHLLIDLRGGRGDLAVGQAVRVDQQVAVRTGHPGGDVIEDQLYPADTLPAACPCPAGRATPVPPGISNPGQ
jgi:hypothetical protein